MQTHTLSIDPRNTDNMSSQLDGAKDNTFFWVLICACSLITVWNFTVYALYKYYEKRVAYIKAKDSFNLLLILISGACLTWGKYVYSMPLFSEESKVGGVVGCLAFGYVFQHLLGSTLLFYALVHRLIKYGSVYQVFERCMCIEKQVEDNGELKWTETGYISMFKRHYKVMIFISMTIILIPMLVFIASAHSAKAIHVDTATGYCSTENTWKFVFIGINLFYFGLLGVLACLIPRYIKDDFLNEAPALAQSILVTLAVFMFETWLSYRPEFQVIPWIGISILLIFFIPTFIIARIFWYPVYQALKNNDHYLYSYMESLEKKKTTGSYYILIVSSPDINNEVLTAFLDYCSKQHGSETLIYTTPMRHIYNVRVETMVMFSTSALDFKDKVAKELFSKSGSGLILGSTYYDLYRQILETYFYNGAMIDQGGIIVSTSNRVSATIPVDYNDFNKVSNYNVKNIEANIFTDVLRLALLHLYNAYFKSFSETDMFFNVCTDELEKKKTSIAYEQLVSTPKITEKTQKQQIPLKPMHTFFKIEEE